VSDGSGEVPATVWSATPVYANGTLYLGTPFYRIVALDPATGAERWSYDSQSRLEALTQPALKNRGVAYWDGGGDGPCAKPRLPRHDGRRACTPSTPTRASAARTSPRAAS
jgi:quinoprotein glucose dehydrogenase